MLQSYFCCNKYVLVAKQFTLGKNERLKSRKQTEQLFKEGKRMSVFPFSVHYQLLPLPTIDYRRSTKFGVGVSRKDFKRAVDRNRIKRLIREAYRLQKQGLYNIVNANNQQLNLFFIYTGKELPEYKFIYDKMSLALQKIQSQIGKQSTK